MTVLGHIKSQGERFRVEKVPITQVVAGDYLYHGSYLQKVRSVEHRPTSGGDPAVWLTLWDGRFGQPYAASLHVKVAYPELEKGKVAID